MSQIVARAAQRENARVAYRGARPQASGNARLDPSRTIFPDSIDTIVLNRDLIRATESPY